jgi:general secretion pathway protein D
MVFIRPTLVRTAAEAREVTAQRYGYIRNEQLRARPTEEPSLDALVRDYLGTVPPVAPPQPGDVAYPPQPAGTPPVQPRR